MKMYLGLVVMVLVLFMFLTADFIQEYRDIRTLQESQKRELPLEDVDFTTRMW